MGKFTFNVTPELLELIPELKEHNYPVGAIMVVSGQTYSPDVIPDEVPPAVEYDNSVTTDDLGSDPTKPRGKYP